MNRAAGYIIPPHVHNPQRREVQLTNEVLLIKSGRVRADLYGSDKVSAESRVLEAGDVILLVSGGHGLEMLEDSEMIEVIRRWRRCSPSSSERRRDRIYFLRGEGISRIANGASCCA